MSSVNMNKKAKSSSSSSALSSINCLSYDVVELVHKHRRDMFLTRIKDFEKKHTESMKKWDHQYDMDIGLPSYVKIDTVIREIGLDDGPYFYKIKLTWFQEPGESDVYYREEFMRFGRFRMLVDVIEDFEEDAHECEHDVECDCESECGGCGECECGCICSCEDCGKWDCECD
jgi:hypothetical protein